MVSRVLLVQKKVNNAHTWSIVTRRVNNHPAGVKTNPFLATSYALSRRQLNTGYFSLVIAYGEVIISWRLQNDNRQLMIMYSVLISYCVYRRPSWTPKNQPNDSSAIYLVEFLVFNSIHLKINVPSDAENRVRRRLVEILVFNSNYLKKVFHLTR